MSQKNNCIVMALSDLRGGGAERVVVNLLNHWPPDRFRPVLLLAEKRGPYLNSLDSAVEILSCDLPFSAANTPHALFRIRTLLRNLEPAAIFAHSMGTSRMLNRARATGVFAAPLMMVVHHNVKSYPAMATQRSLAHYLLRRELSWMYTRASKVIAVSRGAADELETSFPILAENVEKIYNPIDLDSIDHALERIPSDPFFETFRALPRPIILTAGRFSLEKNQALLVEAFARLPPMSRGSLVLFGSGSLAQKLKEMATDLGIAKDVHFPGFVPNPWWYMRSSDIYVSPSKSEAYPMVLLEALACGVPVIATDCKHGPSEIIQSEEFGSLVPVDDPSALATAIAKRLEAGRPEVSKNVRAFLEGYRPDLVAQRYIDVMSKVRN